MMLKPQDVLLTLKVLKLGARPWGFKELSKSLGFSQTEAYNSYRRSRGAGILISTDGGDGKNDKSGKNEVKVNARRLYDFLVHGLPVVFFAERGEVSRGIPTSVWAPPLVDRISIEKSDIPIVWPHPEGRVRGESLVPLYPTVVAVALEDRELYETLALVDALRVGRARERNLAAEILGKRLLPKAGDDKEIT